MGMSLKIEKAHHLFTWQSGLLFILITHGNPFLSDTHFCTALIGWWLLTIYFLFTRGRKKATHIPVILNHLLDN